MMMVVGLFLHNPFLVEQLYRLWIFLLGQVLVLLVLVILGQVLVLLGQVLVLLGQVLVLLGQEVDL